MTQQALVVDRKGLAKKIGNRPKAFVFYELIQNAWDEDVKTVKIETSKTGPICEIVVEDDAPEGFQNLESIYTLFRDSKKSNDPSKRGRFELGEKLVAALALKMVVKTTKGTVIIDGDSRQHTRERTVAGSVVKVSLRMTNDEYVTACEAVKALIPPEGIVTIFNGETLASKAPLKSFEASLQTVVTDSEGALVRSTRKTLVGLHEVSPGETAMIYEMGIPIVATGDKYHYDVRQKVPVNWERNNVPPAFLKTLRVEALNAMASKLQGDDVNQAWVTASLDDERIAPDAVQSVVTSRFGKKSVIYDPSDPEGSKIAVSKGYTVVPGGAFSKGAWDNIKRASALLPAGQVTPSPKPYGEDGKPEIVIAREDWSPDMVRMAEFSERLFQRLIGGHLTVVIVREPLVGWLANFGSRRLCLNYGRLGKSWFALPKRHERVLDLLLHEFVHHTVRDHLSHEMHETSTRLGAKLANIALDDPGLFEG